MITQSGVPIIISASSASGGSTSTTPQDSLIYTRTEVVEITTTTRDTAVFPIRPIDANTIFVNKARLQLEMSAAGTVNIKVFKATTLLIDQQMNFASAGMYAIELILNTEVLSTEDIIVSVEDGGVYNYGVWGVDLIGHYV